MEGIRQGSAVGQIELVVFEGEFFLNFVYFEILAVLCSRAGPYHTVQGNTGIM